MKWHKNCSHPTTVGPGRIARFSVPLEDKGKSQTGQLKQYLQVTGDKSVLPKDSIIGV